MEINCEWPHNMEKIVYALIDEGYIVTIEKVMKNWPYERQIDYYSINAKKDEGD